MKESEHISTIKPEVILPNAFINAKPIHARLSQTHWTLIVCGKEKIKFRINQLKICHVPENTYPLRYILIRPSWHMALTADTISEDGIMSYIGVNE
jgi:hypothetical protein